MAGSAGGRPRRALRPAPGPTPRRPLLATGVLAPATVRDLPAAMDALCDRLHRALPDIVAALDPGAGLARTPLDEPDRTAALPTAHGALTAADDRTWSTS